MSKTTATLKLAALAAALAGAAAPPPARAQDAAMPTVTMMVGGIDKQIYLPYQLAEGLGFYKKFGVKMVLSTESEGGVGAEEAMVSGQVDMAGAWYVHTIDFQLHGKAVIDVAQLSASPGEREMCAKGSSVASPADWRGKSVGVTDIGSGTDDLTLYLAARSHLATTDFSRLSAGAGPTLISALKYGRIVCGMTTQPTVNAIEKLGVGYSAIDLTTAQGVQKWLGGFWPTSSVLARSEWVDAHKDATQRVVNALVATMHYIATHSAADIADHMPADFVQNPLSTRQEYVAALTLDKAQFLPDGMMPPGGPNTVLAVEKLAGKITQAVDLPVTYTNAFAIEANRLQGFAK